MKTIKQLLDEKGSKVWSIGPDESVYDAVALMAEKGIGALLVIGDDRTIGMVSERDYARNVVLKGRSSKKIKVSEIMSDRVICIEPDRTVEEGMALMTDKRVRHLPVIEGGDVLGLVSIGDLVKEIISEQKFIIEQLEHYISS